MMGVAPGDARAMTWWEYTAMLTVWNARHAPPDKFADVEPPSAEKVRAEFARHGVSLH